MDPAEAETYYHAWGVYKSKPDRFNAVIKQYSESTRGDYMKEWKLIDFAADRTLQSSVKSGNGKRCICSQYITNKYYIKNSINQSVLIIGSECIGKFGSQEMKEVHAIKKRISAYEGNKRMCQSCGKYRIGANKHPNIKFCTPCYNSGNRTVSEFVGQATNMRECIKCKKQNIPSNAESWKKQCPSCYFS